MPAYGFIILASPVTFLENNVSIALGTNYRIYSFQQDIYLREDNRMPVLTLQWRMVLRLFFLLDLFFFFFFLDLFFFLLDYFMVVIFEDRLSSFHMDSLHFNRFVARFTRALSDHTVVGHRRKRNIRHAGWAQLFIHFGCCCYCLYLFDEVDKIRPIIGNNSIEVYR